MNVIFRNKERQVRAGWELLLVVVAVLAVTVVASLIMSVKVDSKHVFGPDGWPQVFRSLGLYMFLVVGLTVKFVHKRPLSSIGLTRPDGRRLLQGCLAGAALISSVIAVLWVLGAATFTGDWQQPQWQRLDAPDIVVSVLLAGVCEEVMFRGYIQHLLGRRLSMFWGVAVSAALFSLAHAANPGYSWISALNIVLIAVLFSWATIRTGSLYFAIGLHMFWNLLQGFVYSVAVSGLESQGIYSMQLSGSKWISGGSFGVEGSLITTAILLIVCLCTLLRSSRKRSGRIPGPR